MTSIWTTVRALVSTLALAALALPAGAATPDKIYSLNVSALGVAPVAVTIKNETPNGNSTVNSFIIKPPAGVSVTVASPASSASATVTKNANGWIYVNGFTGLQAGNKSPKTITIYLNATYSGGATCNTGFTWTAQAFTGNAWGSEEFSYVVGTNPVTNPTQMAACNYSLKMAPASVPKGASGTAMTATFKNENATGGPSINAVTLAAPSASGLTIKTSSSGTVSASGVSATGLSIAPGASLVLNLTVDATCTASGGNWTSSATGGGAFSLATGASVLGTTTTGGCSYSYTVTPSPLSAGTSSSLTATVTNGSAAGGATIDSFTLTVPSGAKFTITGVTPSAANISFTSTSVTVSPAALAAGASVVLTLAVDAACATSSGSWTDSVTSSSGTFTRTGSAPGTAVSGACTMVFTQQPTSAVAGEAIIPPIVVTAKGATGSPIPWFTGAVTLNTGGCGTGQVASVNASGGTATFSSVVLTTPGTYTLTACSNLGTASTTFAVSSNSFSVFAGVILCGEPFDPLTISNPPTATKGHPENYPPEPPSVGFARGKRLGNKDSSNCPDPGARIPYTFTNTIPTNNTVILDWDAIAAPYAVFRYQVTLQDEPVGADGLPSYTTLLLFPDSPNGTKIPRVGVACLSSDPAGILGKLGANISASDSTVTITGIATVPQSPIAIWVTSLSTGTGGERMEATQTGMTGSGPYSVTYSVIRGDGSTTPVIHNANDDVYITPLPVDPNAFLPNGTTVNFFHNKQVPMCIISERWEAIGGTLLRPTVDAYDSGDGGIIRAP